MLILMLAQRAMAMRSDRCLQRCVDCFVAPLLAKTSREGAHRGERCDSHECPPPSLKGYPFDTNLVDRRTPYTLQFPSGEAIQVLDAGCADARRI